MSLGVGEKTVEEYLKELGQGRANKPDDVKEALDTYLELWKTAIEKGTIDGDEGIADALLKLDKLGGLYAVAKREEEENEESQD